MSVTFATSCWERDWDILLRTKFLQNKIERNDYDFAKKALIINNVNNRVKVEKFAIEAVDKGVISDYFFVEDYIDEALEYFELTKEALGKGYHYSNHELASVYLCKTNYLLFFTGDTSLTKKSLVQSALAEFEKNPEYKVSNLFGITSLMTQKSKRQVKSKIFMLALAFQTNVSWSEPLTSKHPYTMN